MVGKPDSALVLLGHGSTVNGQSSATVYAHAAELRRRSVFGQVLEAFWKQEPHLLAVVDGCLCSRIYIVPFFASEGFFTEEVIPAALGFPRTAKGAYARVQERDSRRLSYCRPVGTHERITPVILARALDIIHRFPFPRPPDSHDTALFIAGHGTEKNENSRAAVETEVGAVRRTEAFAEVHGVYLEESPRISECYELTDRKNLVVVPFFMSDGLHVNQDIPVLLGESATTVRDRLERGLLPWRNPTERHGRRVWYAGSIGTEPSLTEVILARVSEVGGTNSNRLE